MYQRLIIISVLSLSVILNPFEVLADPEIVLEVEVSVIRHTIPDTIYGMNFADQAMAEELNLGVVRSGGNATTRYNYLLDTSNRGSDWYFENVPHRNAHPDDLPGGSSIDQFVEANNAAQTHTILTMPLIGWTPAARAYACGYSVQKYGPQQQVDPYRNDCGNGILTTGMEITANDPDDISVPIGPDFVIGWIQHLTELFGSADQGGVKFYNLDNEPMLWSHTHRDVHQQSTSYDEIIEKTERYAAAIKEADPGALTLGPVVWGYMAYFWSALDNDNGNQDNASHGKDFIPWYLEQMHHYENQHGKRILDYLDLHYYPQADGVTLSSAGDASTQELRLRASRSLWDPSYVDESWIGQWMEVKTIRLIPRMQEWVANNYPGTKLAITEYNFGGLEHINGALAQADVLGIFGEFRLDLATLWAPPDIDQPGAFAFRMYRNYDGLGSTFGDKSVVFSSSNRDDMAVYASLRSSDEALTVMVINKTHSAINAGVNISGFESMDSCEVYQYSGTNLDAILQLDNLSISENSITTVYPSNSITLLVISPGQSVLKGDVDGNNIIDLRDAITALRVIARLSVQAVEQNADVNGDQKIGLAEVIRVMGLTAQ